MREIQQGIQHKMWSREPLLDRLEGRRIRRVPRKGYIIVDGVSPLVVCHLVYKVTPTGNASPSFEHPRFPCSQSKGFWDFVISWERLTTEFFAIFGPV